MTYGYDDSLTESSFTTYRGFTLTVTQTSVHCVVRYMTYDASNSSAGSIISGSEDNPLTSMSEKFEELKRSVDDYYLNQGDW